MVNQAAKISLKSVALPAEHGGWGFLLEPVLLGLLVAPSVSGLWLSLAAVGIFLLHQPLKITLKDRLKGKRYARTVFAERFALGYALLAVSGLMLTLVNAQHHFWQPIILVLPFALVQTTYEIRNEGREWIPEISGALALGAIAPTIALSSGWHFLPAMLLWVLLALRSVTSILYVRSRLRLEKSKAAQVSVPLLAHIIALLLVGILAIAEETSLWSVIAISILTLRAFIGLSAFRKPRKARSIGFMEMGYGLLAIILFSI